MKVKYTTPKPSKKPNGKTRIWSVSLNNEFAEQNKKAIKQLEELSGLQLPSKNKTV